jgi:hypothetical protein
MATRVKQINEETAAIIKLSSTIYRQSSFKSWAARATFNCEAFSISLQPL